MCKLSWVIGMGPRGARTEWHDGVYDVSQGRLVGICGADGRCVDCRVRVDRRRGRGEVGARFGWDGLRGARWWVSAGQNWACICRKHVNVPPVVTVRAKAVFPLAPRTT